MKKKSEKYEALLSASVIDDFSLRIQDFMKRNGFPRRDILRYCLTAEEILLKTMDSGKENIPVRLIMGTRFYQPYIILETDGAEENIFLLQENEQTYFGSRILKSIGVSPEYSYSEGANRYYFRLRKRVLSPFMSLLLTLSLAAATGFLGLLLPEAFRASLLDHLLTPVHDAFLNMLGCIAGPMIFLAVAWGIYGIGDVTTLKRVGRNVLLGYISTAAVAVTVIGTAIVPLFSLSFSGGSGGSSELSTVFSMLLNIIPKNIFSPFVDGNTLQIIFLAVVIGISMIFLNQRTDAVAQVIEQINYIVQSLIEFISRLVPFFIYIVVVRMIWTDISATLTNLGKLFAVFAGTAAALCIGVVIVTAIRNRVNPLLLIRKGLPTFLIAVTTASSAATFGTNVEACRKKYGIDELITSFGIPLALATFKPCTAFNYLVMMFFFAETYQVAVSPAWIVLALFTCIVLALATPPIPGGAMSAYTVLLTQLGIPIEALAIALACDAVFDFLDTGVDQFLLPFPLLTQAGKLGLLDRDVLRRK